MVWFGPSLYPKLIVTCSVSISNLLVLSTFLMFQTKRQVNLASVDLPYPGAYFTIYTNSILMEMHRFLKDHLSFGTQCSGVWILNIVIHLYDETPTETMWQNPSEYVKDVPLSATNNKNICQLKSRNGNSSNQQKYAQYTEVENPFSN